MLSPALTHAAASGAHCRTTSAQAAGPRTAAPAAPWLARRARSERARPARGLHVCAVGAGP